VFRWNNYAKTLIFVAEEAAPTIWARVEPHCYTPPYTPHIPPRFGGKKGHKGQTIEITREYAWQEGG